MSLIIELSNYSPGPGKRLSVEDYEGSVVVCVDLEDREGLSGWRRGDKEAVESAIARLSDAPGPEVRILIDEIARLEHCLQPARDITRSFEPGEARALAAALIHFADEIERQWR